MHHETDLKNVLNYVRLLSANIRKYLLNKKKMNKKKITKWLKNNVNRLEGQENILNEEYLKVLKEIDLNLTIVLFKNILVEFASENGYKIAFSQRILNTYDDVIKIEKFTITPII